MSRCSVSPPAGHPVLLSLHPASEEYLGCTGDFQVPTGKAGLVQERKWKEAFKKMLVWLSDTLIHIAHKTVIMFSTGAPSVSSAPPGARI